MLVGTDLTFGGSVDSQPNTTRNLTINAGVSLGTGSASFQGAVGSLVGLGDILVENATDVYFESSLLASSLTQSAGSGETRFDGPVTIKTAAGVDLTTGSVTINHSFDTSAASGPIRITASGDIAVNGFVTSATAAVELSADNDVLFGSDSAIITSGASVKILADADASLNGNGGAVLMADGAVIDTGGGVIDIAADGRWRSARSMDCQGSRTAPSERPKTSAAIVLTEVSIGFAVPTPVLERSASRSATISAPPESPPSTIAPPPDSNRVVSSLPGCRSADSLVVLAADEAGQMTDDGGVPIVRDAAPKDSPEADVEGDAPALRRSSWLLPAAASAVPWRTRVRKALGSETHSISRTSLRLRRHR